MPALTPWLTENDQHSSPSEAMAQLLQFEAIPDWVAVGGAPVHAGTLTVVEAPGPPRA